MLLECWLSRLTSTTRSSVAAVITVGARFVTMTEGALLVACGGAADGALLGATDGALLGAIDSALLSATDGALLSATDGVLLTATDALEVTLVGGAIVVDGALLGGATALDGSLLITVGDLGGLITLNVCLTSVTFVSALTNTGFSGSVLLITTIEA